MELGNAVACLTEITKLFISVRILGTNMKFSCELTVSEVLPVARRFIAMELVTVYGYSQMDIAKKMGITGSAVSQYISGVRGRSDLLERCQQFSDFIDLTRACSERIAGGKSRMVDELCIVCSFSKTSGMLNELVEYIEGGQEYSKCQQCPSAGITKPWE